MKLENDFEKEEEFKNIVRLASYICKTPSVLINFLDKNNQYTVFSVGWENKKIPKKESICQFTEKAGGLLYIPDTRKDSRINQIEAVQNDPRIGFYAGISFKGNNEILNGTLCVIDEKPRELSEMQKEALKILATEIESRLELIKSKQAISRQNEKLIKTARFLKNSTDVMLVLDPETLIIKEVHAEDNSKLGYTPNELENTPFTDYCTGEKYVDELENWLHTYQSEKFTFETYFIKKSGDSIFLRLNASLADGLIYLTGRDISEQNNAEEQLKKEMLLSDGIIENLPGIFCLINEDGKIKRWNKNLEFVTGFNAKAIRNKSVENFLAYESLQSAYYKLKEIFNHKSAKTEIVIVSKKGDKIPFLLSGFRYTVDGENFAAVIGVNISEEKQALRQLQHKEDSLKAALQRLENAQHIARLGSWEWDVKNGNLHWSEETYEILQIDKNKEKNSINLLFDLMNTADKKKMLNAIDNILNGEPMQDFEHDIFLPDGSVKHVYERGEVTVTENGRPIKVMGTIQDITEQIKAEEKLKKILKEKEVMLSEIHHRVKNNLAVVSGLLQLEADHTTDSKSSGSLLKSVTRIKSMAAIHEKLYTTGNFLNVSFGSYVNELVTFIENLYQNKVSENKITVKITSDEFDLNINQAIPCALILNELLTNAYKHAFPDGKAGFIQINIEEKEKEIYFTVKDNGIGIPEDKIKRNKSSLGFTLLNVLCKQIKATYKIDGKEGTTVKIGFNKEQSGRGSSGNLFRS